MRYLLLLICIALVAACAGTPEAPPPVVVKVAVREACIDSLPPEPNYETNHLERDDSLCVIADALLVERVQRMIYIKQLQAAIAGCMSEAK